MNTLQREHVIARARYFEWTFLAFAAVHIMGAWILRHPLASIDTAVAFGLLASAATLIGSYLKLGEPVVDTFLPRWIRPELSDNWHYWKSPDVAACGLRVKAAAFTGFSGVPDAAPVCTRCKEVSNVGL